LEEKNEKLQAQIATQNQEISKLVTALNEEINNNPNSTINFD
jgi:hypothetical protein